MITAKEAKELYDKSGIEVENFLTSKVDPEVRKRASAGNRNATIDIGVIPVFSHLDSVILPLHKAVVEKLKLLGFQAEIRLYGERYVPRGLMSDDGSGPKHQNYGIVIGW